MKWLALALAGLLGVPLLARACVGSARARRLVVALIAAGLFNFPVMYLVSWAQYRGDSLGVEVTTVNLLTLALYIAQRVARRPRDAARHFALTRYVHLGAVLLSFAATPDVQLSFYGLWKLLRMYFFFSVLATAFTELAMVRAALQGLGAGFLLQAGIAFYQKYGRHMVRVSGSMPHSNTLAMLANLIAPVAFTLFLSGRGTWVTVAVFASAGLCEIFTLSRGGMLMFGMAIVLGCAGSALRGLDRRKVTLMLVVFAGAGVAFLKALHTIIERFETAPPESELARVLFNRAARAMADEHPLGVGINMYSYVLAHGGYADRIGMLHGDRDGIAHHIYWLTAAETGYFGLATYLALIATIYVAAVRTAFLRGVRGEIGLGIVVGLTTMYLQGTAEWVARQTPMAYCFWLLVAIVAGFRERQAVAARLARGAGHGP